jgi:hypothetical protein
MLYVDLTINVLTLIAIVAGSILAGYLLRSRQLHKKQFRISELRKEIVYNHAQILELQKEYVSLEKSIKGTNASPAPVLPMNSVAETKEAL